MTIEDRAGAAGGRAASSEELQVPGWPPPRGYANGRAVATGTRTIYVAGQIGWDARGELADGLAAQFARALDNVLSVVAAGGVEGLGGGPFAPALHLAVGSPGDPKCAERVGQTGRVRPVADLLAGADRAMALDPGNRDALAARAQL